MPKVKLIENKINFEGMHFKDNSLRIWHGRCLKYFTEKKLAVSVQPLLWYK